jgi:hypothetical protein
VGPNIPWQNYVLLCSLSAFVGGGCGAGSALVFAERRVGEVEATVDALERRVSLLERLADRVARLEAGRRPSVP